MASLNSVQEASLLVEIVKTMALFNSTTPQQRAAAMSKMHELVKRAPNVVVMYLDSLPKSINGNGSMAAKLRAVAVERMVCQEKASLMSEGGSGSQASHNRSVVTMNLAGLDLSNLSLAQDHDSSQGGIGFDPYNSMGRSRLAS
jgi:hypothetical protein